MTEAQEAWVQERRAISGDRDKYRIEKNVVRHQVAQRDDYMQESIYWRCVYDHVIPDPS